MGNFFYQIEEQGMSSLLMGTFASVFFFHGDNAFADGVQETKCEFL